MKLPDVNVLLYAVNTASPQHAVAKQALQEAFTEGDVGLPWAVLLGFLRLTTRSGILSQPLTVDDALQIVHSWLDHPAATTLAPGDRHAAILSRLLIGAGQGGSLVSDAHLAALAIEHNAELLSFDRDFARFAGLRWTALA
jgi:toxin-antitoxin system PIN domain toxin